MRWPILLLSLGCSSNIGERFQLGTPLPSPTGDTGPPIPTTPIDTPEPTDTGLPEPPCEAPCVDVVFVVDSSPSMDEIQMQLAQSGVGLFEALEGIDFHVGTITMDLTDPIAAGTLQRGVEARWITPETLNPVSEFASMVQLGTAGASQEAGIGAARLLIFVKADQTPNTGFRRPGAPLHLVFVSNEDDQTPDDVLTEATEAFAALPGGTRAHSLVAFDFGRGERYLTLTDTLGGVTAAIETADYAAFLDEVTLQITAP
ncbi:MAG: hypothetical protein AAF211_01370 [Myxococcota bacterium]